MGYALVFGNCFGCGRSFGFNPVRVPSYQGKPICKECIEAVNKKRAELGNPLWPVPEDAYTACHESELP